MNSEWEHGIKLQFMNDDLEWDIQIPFGGTLQDSFRSPTMKLTRCVNS